MPDRTFQLRADLPVFPQPQISLRENKLLLPCAALAVVAAHLCLSLLTPTREWITCTAWIAMYSVALLATLKASRSAPASSRWRWRMVVINFSLAICSFATILYSEYWSHGSPAAAWLDDLLRAYRSLPLLLAVCTPEEAPRLLNRVLDVLQTIVIAFIFFVLFYPASLRSGPPDPVLVNRYNYALAVILALLAMLATFTARSMDSRLFHRVLALYLWIGVPVNLWTNHVLINTLNVPAASPYFVPSDLCLLAYVLAIPLLSDSLKPKLPNRRLLLMRLGTPAFLPLFTVLASMLLGVAGHHPVLGISTGVTGLALFGVRSAYGQFQLLSTQWELESANERLASLSHRDSLTGLYNRRWFAETFAAEWERAQRQRQPFSLLLLDVDHFKLFNDSRGHVAGDACLRAVAQLAAGQLRRPGDALVRYGGEEFVAMLPNTDPEGATRVAEGIMEALRESQLPHPSSPFGYVTLSIGGVSWRKAHPGARSEELLLQADAALYEAKEQGRNRIRMVEDAAADT